MYAPIPGYAHVMVFHPQDPITYSGTPGTTQAANTAPRSQARELVTIVIETAIGLRPAHHMRAPRFHKSIALHIRAWTRGHTHLMSTPVYRLRSLHTLPNGEFFGSVDMGPEPKSRTHAFTGCVEGSTLTSFRLI